MKFSFVFFTMLCLWYSAANAVENCIDWHERPKLQWSDFQGTVAEDSPFAAMTYWYLYYRWKGNKVLAESCFQTSKSWVREGKESDYLLQHEQLHVDIAQLHIRLFKQKIEFATSADQVKKAFDEVLKARNGRRCNMMKKRNILVIKPNKNVGIGWWLRSWKTWMITVQISRS